MRLAYLHSRVAYTGDDVNDDLNRGTVIEYPAIDPDGKKRYDLAVVSWDEVEGGKVSTLRDGSILDNVDISKLLIVGTSIEAVWDSLRDDIAELIDTYSRDTDVNRDRALAELVSSGFAVHRQDQRAAGMFAPSTPDPAPTHNPRIGVFGADKWGRSPRS